MLARGFIPLGGNCRRSPTMPFGRIFPVSGQQLHRRNLTRLFWSCPWSAFGLVEFVYTRGVCSLVVLNCHFCAFCTDATKHALLIDDQPPRTSRTYQVIVARTCHSKWKIHVHTKILTKPYCSVSAQMSCTWSGRLHRVWLCVCVFLFFSFLLGVFSFFFRFRIGFVVR